MDDSGFLQAICENPYDISIRLIYADWLTERDDPRGEFIRVQCELARLKETRRAIPMTPENEERHARREALRRRERELLTATNAHRWGSPAKDWVLARQGDVFSIKQVGVPGYPLEVQFRRGFVEVVSCTCADWLAYGPAIVWAQPVLEVQMPDTLAVISPDGNFRLVPFWYDPADRKGRLAIAWARGPHPDRNLEALPLLEETIAR